MSGFKIFVCNDDLKDYLVEKGIPEDLIVVSKELPIIEENPKLKVFPEVMELGESEQRKFLNGEWKCETTHPKPKVNKKHKYSYKGR